MSSYPRIGAIKTVEEFRSHLQRLGLTLPCDDAALSADQGSPLAQPFQFGDRTVGNRWCVHPMEGWDGTVAGKPSEHTIRRWRHFGESGCKLIWGGEAVAVCHQGRANPHQLFHCAENADALAGLLTTLEQAHRESFGPNATDDLVVGLQLTHSGRFCRPNRKDRLEPRIVYHHPLLDQKFGIDPQDDSMVLADGEIRALIDLYVAAAKTAQRVGYHFVDVKCCHGYLGHEFLSARSRPGPYGGDLEGRTRFVREIIAGIRSECPGLDVGVRLSIFDFPSFHPDPGRAVGKKLGPGIPDGLPTGSFLPFGVSAKDPFSIDLTEPIEVARRLRDELGVKLFNFTAGSPYYNPHIQRPAFYPPSDGYQPPEDPLIGCVRQIHATQELKRNLPDVGIVGSAYTYMQEFLPQVAQGVVREGWTDFVGIGRLVLSEWTLPAKVLAGTDYKSTKKICRTFSDCTTAPRNGLVSGCYPLDDYYKGLPEAASLKEVKSSS